MLTVFRATLKTLVRDPGLFVWALLFPLLLSTMFMFMFSNIDEELSFQAVPVAVVDDAAWDGSELEAVVESLSEAGEDQLLDVHAFESGEEADAALRGGEVSGVLSVDDAGSCTLRVLPDTGNLGVEAINATVLQTVANTYDRDAALVHAIAERDPLAFADSERVESAFSPGGHTEQVSLTRSEPVESVRFYYAMFGMAALFGAQVGMTAICRAQPNLSPLGARRAVGAISRGRVLAATLAASWVVSFGCLLVAFAYVRLVVGIDFAGREGLCVAGLAAAALFATAFGTFIGALPKLSLSSKSGILTGATCFLSLFAGLYGEPCMELADMIARQAPLLAALNPAKVVTDLFYSLYYYDALGPFAGKVGMLFAQAAVLFAASAVFVRKQRYASL